MPRDDPTTSSSSEEDETTEEEEESDESEESEEEEEESTTAETSTGNGTTTATTTTNETSTTQETTESTAVTSSVTATNDTAPVGREDPTRRSVSFAANHAAAASSSKRSGTTETTGTTETGTTETGTTEEEEEEDDESDEEEEEDEESDDGEEEEEEEEESTTTEQTTETTATSTQASTAPPVAAKPSRRKSASTGSTTTSESTSHSSKTTESSTVDKGPSRATGAQKKSESSPTSTSRSQSTSEGTTTETRSSSSPTESSNPTTSDKRPSTISAKSTGDSSSNAAATVGNATQAAPKSRDVTPAAAKSGDAPSKPVPKPPPKAAAATAGEATAAPEARGKGWKKAKGAVTGDEVSPEAAAKAAEAARQLSTTASPTAPSDNTTVPHPKPESTQEPLTGTDGTLPAKPPQRYHNQAASETSSDEASEETSDGEEDEEESETSTTGSAKVLSGTMAAPPAAPTLPHKEAGDDGRSSAPKDEETTAVRVRGTVVIDASAPTSRRPASKCPAQLLTSSASPDIATLLSAINGEGVATREDFLKAARVIGISSKDAIKMQVRRGERIPAPDAAKLLESHLIKMSVARLKNAFAQLDAFGSGEVSDRDFHRVFGGIKGFSIEAMDDVALSLSFVERKLFITGNAMAQAADISFPELDAGRLIIDSNLKAWFSFATADAPQLPLFPVPAGSNLGQAFDQLQFVARCFETARYADNAVDYEAFISDALVVPNETAEHTSIGMAAIASHTLALPLAMKKPLSDDTQLEPFLWKPYHDSSTRDRAFLPPVEMEHGQPHIVMRSPQDAPKYTRVLVLETVSVHPYLANASVCLEDGVSCFALASIIRTGDDIFPPVRLQAVPLKDDPGTWKFRSQRRRLPTPKLFIQADDNDIVYIEYCIQRPKEAVPTSVAFSTMEAGNLAEVNAAEPVDMAMWVNGGSFYHRLKPLNKAAGRPRGGCCSSSNANDCLAVGTIVPLPSRLMPAAADLDLSRLRLLPRVCMLRLHHLHFILCYLHQLFLAQQTEPVYMVMRQDPFRALAELTRDADRFDLAAVLWQEMALRNDAVLKDNDSEIRRRLSDLAGDLMGTTEVGGVEQRWKRITAAKGETVSKVAILDNAPLKPSVPPLGGFALRDRTSGH